MTNGDNWTFVENKGSSEMLALHVWIRFGLLEAIFFVTCFLQELRVASCVAKEFFL